MKLKPCPFCGRKGELWNNKLTYRLYGVICEECDCMTPYFTTREEAIEAWNRREPIDKVVEQLEEQFDCTVNWDMRLAYNHAIEIVKGGAV